MSDQVIAAAGAVKPTGVRWKIFFLLLFLVSVNYIDRASLSVAMPLISKEFNIDPAWQGLILSSFFWTYAFMQVRAACWPTASSRESWWRWQPCSGARSRRSRRCRPAGSCCC
jgi:MFS family permease